MPRQKQRTQIMGGGDRRHGPSLGSMYMWYLDMTYTLETILVFDALICVLCRTGDMEVRQPMWWLISARKGNDNRPASYFDRCLVPLTIQLYSAMIISLFETQLKHTFNNYEIVLIDSVHRSTFARRRHD